METIRVVIVSMYLKMIRTSCSAQLEYGTNARTQPVATVERKRDRLVIGSSEQVHVVDALAITGDE
ncbi:hypothetical protein KTE55_37625, partial [Burkholderia gladioli]|nr:hypothetical protein [Burkholderia gladioli]